MDNINSIFLMSDLSQSFNTFIGRNEMMMCIDYVMLKCKWNLFTIYSYFFTMTISTITHCPKQYLLLHWSKTISTITLAQDNIHYNMFSRTIYLLLHWSKTISTITLAQDNIHYYMFSKTTIYLLLHWSKTISTITLVQTNIHYYTGRL